MSQRELLVKTERVRYPLGFSLTIGLNTHRRSLLVDGKNNLYKNNLLSAIWIFQLHLLVQYFIGWATD
jgi:hypothetical protein